MTDDELWEKITDYYLRSRDFNGLPVRVVEMPLSKLKQALKRLVIAGDISLILEGFDVNPYVKRLKPRKTNEQIEALRKVKDITHVVAYPEGDRLKRAVKSQRFSGRPYSLAMAKGRPCLECAYFKLDVLEKFRNDPRYSYHFNDVGGSISARTEMGKEEVFVRPGFAYDEDMNRAVCVFYADLTGMNKEQQQYWKHFELDGPYRPHPDFIWSQVYGQWPEKASLPEAFTAELVAINQYTKDCYDKPLFKHEYQDGKRPKELAFLIRPTAKELNGFIHILDKMVSENINPKFFKGEVDPEVETVRGDGKVVVSRKGTLTMLEEFVRANFPFAPNRMKPVDDMFATFKKIRKQRTAPAHSIEEDEFNQKYFKEQRELFIEAYTALRMLRLILQNHPKADRTKIPDWLYKGDITTF